MYDLEPRLCPPEFMADVLTDHDRTMRDRSLAFQRFRALWRTRYWQDRLGEGAADRYTDRALGTGAGRSIRIEVNRIHGYVTSFVGALFTEDVKVGYEPDPEGKGNPKLSQTTVNHVLHSKRVALRTIDAIRQAVIYDGAGLKIGVDHDGRDPLRRVWSRVIPWWEMVLDRDVRDRDDARFIGHAYWIPKAAAIRRFKIPDVVATRQPEAMEDPGRAGMPRPTDLPVTASDPLNQQFVRVFEVYNLVDDYVIGEADPVTGVPYTDWKPVCHEDGTVARIRGRYEVYLPDQPGGCNKGPVRVYPMPFAAVDGRPRPSIVPLVLNYDPEYPLHGLSTVERVYDQLRETILERTAKANAVKKNARQMVARKGLFDAAAKQSYADGVDGELIEFEVKDGDTQSASTAMYPLQLPNVNRDNDIYAAQIDEDIVRGTSQPPFNAGQPTGVSATEANLLAAHAKTGLGLLALMRDLFLEDVQELIRLALVASLRGLGNDARIKLTERDRVIEVSAADLAADFSVKIKSPPFTEIEEDRERQTFLTVMPLVKPLIEAWAKPPHNPLDAQVLDEFVDRFRLPREFSSDAVQRLLQGEGLWDPPPEAPPTDTPAGADIPRLPGAGSALPGQGSTPGLPEGGGTEPMDGAGGGPMPRGPMPADVQAGTAQNGVSA